MRKNDLAEAKKIDMNLLKIRILTIRKELADLTLDKNMDKLKDVKSISKKRRDLAQLLTIKRQKEMMNELEIIAKKKGEKQ